MKRLAVALALVAASTSTHRLTFVQVTTTGSFSALISYPGITNPLIITRSTVAIMIMFGILDFGRAMSTYDQIAYAARIGTRYASVNGSASCSTSGCAATASQIQTERDILRDRVKAGIAQARRDGKPHGRPSVELRRKPLIVLGARFWN